MSKWLLLVGLLHSFALCAQSSSSTALSAVIIGSGSPQFDVNRAGPSVLVRMGETEILVDIGNGTQAQLERIGVPIKNLDGLLFTHHHLDHNEEFIPVFIRALLGNNRFTLAGPTPMRKMTDATLELYKKDIEYRMRRSGRVLSNVVRNVTVSELTGGESFAIGGIKVSTAKVNHTIETTAFRFDAGGHSIVVSGDLTYSSSLSALAKNADYLIIDSGGTVKAGQGARLRPLTQVQSRPTSLAEQTARQTSLAEQAARQTSLAEQAARQTSRAQEISGTASRQRARNRQVSSSGAVNGNQNRAHVTLEETARMASEAKVKAIVLTHFTPGEIDEPATIAKLRKGYAGEILFAHDRMIIAGTSAVPVPSN